MRTMNNLFQKFTDISQKSAGGSPIARTAAPSPNGRADNLPDGPIPRQKRNLPAAPGRGQVPQSQLQF